MEGSLNSSTKLQYERRIEDFSKRYKLRLLGKDVIENGRVSVNQIKVGRVNIRLEVVRSFGLV